MTEQEKTIQTIYGEQTEHDVIRTLAGELEHINKLFKWQINQSVKLGKEVKRLEEKNHKMCEALRKIAEWDLTGIAIAALEGGE